jgi:hypothetical protein
MRLGAQPVVQKTTYRCVCIRFVTTFLAGWTRMTLRAKQLQAKAGVQISPQKAAGLGTMRLTESARTRRAQQLVRTCAVRNALSI